FVSNEDAGQYVLTTIDGCITVINLNVSGNCDPGDTPISAEWRIGGSGNPYESESEGVNASITADNGQEVRLSILPNGLGYKVITPNGGIIENLTGDYIITNVTNDNTGLYLLESDQGCSVAIDVTINQVVCDATTLRAEWSLDGGNTYNEAPDNLPVTIEANTGDNVILSMIPNGITFTVSLNGVEVYSGVGDYILGNIGFSDSGVYVITSSEGCSTSIDLDVIGELEPCLPERSIPEYRINGNWQSGSTELSLELGTSLMLSMLPNNIDVSITLPNGDVVGDDYSLGNIGFSDSGVYVITSSEGCSTSIDLDVIGELEPCLPERSIPEYRINGNWQSGSTELSLELGTSLMLSMLPNNIDVSITLPNGDVVGDDYSLGNIGFSDSGVYVITSSEGCSTSIDLEIFDSVSLKFNSKEKTSVNNNEVLIYPNPTASIINIDLSSKLNEALDVRVINSSGQVAYFVNYNKDHKAIEKLNLGTLSDGVYLIIIEGINYKISKSVILKK
ncbi:putative secreted protein (Por secretion system target), partial [Maribacter vaceletii]